MRNSNYDRITKISLSDDTNSVILIDDLNEKDIILNENDPEDLTYLNQLFNTMANDDIRLIKHLSDDRLLITTKTKGKKTIATEISDYSNIKNKKYFKKMKKTILEYNLAKILYNLYKESKTKRFKIALAGSLVSVATVITLNSINNISKAECITNTETINQFASDHNIELNNALNDEIIITQNNNEIDNDILTEEHAEINDNITNEDSIEINKDIIVEDSSEVNKDIIIEDLNVLENNDSNYVPSENIDNEYSPIEQGYIDFSQLKEFNDYDQYIKFAANLFYIDYDEAKNIVGQNFNTFTNSTHIELSRMKVLKDKGIIDGDLNVMGIFITIKDYSISHYGLDSQKPIKTNKTPEEREIDLINVAKNIYGINDVELLNCIIAVHRLETGHGKEAIATEKNNLGGNLSANYKEQIVVNTYKTTEIGAESMIRNFLNVYYKCLYDERCNNLDPTPVFMSKLYCTHTPEAWATEVTNLLEEGKIQPAVNKYLGNSKTY